jgi:hypothetical protein
MRAALRFPQGVGKSGYFCYLAPMTANGPPSDALLTALYDGIVDAGGLERALGLLAEQFHCPSAALISFDAAAPEADVVSSAGMFAEPHCSAPTTKSGRRSIRPRAPSRR